MIFYKKKYSEKGVRDKSYRKSLKYKTKISGSVKNSTHYPKIEGGKFYEIRIL